MNKKVIAVAFVAATCVGAAKAETLDNDNKKVSYLFGLQFGAQIGNVISDPDWESLNMGAKHGFEGTKPLLDEAESKKIIADFRAEHMKKQRKAEQLAGAANAKKGELFLEQNKSKSGVKITDSGLQYKVLKKGDGAKPGLEDTVKVHYHGTLVDGMVFDSSVDRGEPISFPVKGVIAGWTEALQLMTVGSKWQLFIPSNLAYGERGAGQAIGPNSTLIFEVELLDIES